MSCRTDKLLLIISDTLSCRTLTLLPISDPTSSRTSADKVSCRTYKLPLISDTVSCRTYKLLLIISGTVSCRTYKLLLIISNTVSCRTYKLLLIISDAVSCRTYRLHLTSFAVVLLYPVDIDDTMRRKMCRITCKTFHSSRIFRIAYATLKFIEMHLLCSDFITW